MISILDTNKCSIYNNYIATDNRASYIGGIIVEKTKECDEKVLYEDKIVEMVNSINDTGTLEYLYTFIKLFLEKWGC